MHTHPLDDVAIATPCSADWNQMVGDDKSRHCAQCRLQVHDLSAMTRDEAIAFLRAVGRGRACVRLFRRADGRVLTKDCPVGLRSKLRRARARLAALWLALWAVPSSCSGSASGSSNDPERGYVMGRMAAPDLTTQTPSLTAEPAKDSVTPTSK